MIYLYAASAILAGAFIGLACRVKTDRALWRQRLRGLRSSQRRLEHRKAFFRLPRDSGECIAPLLECIVLIAMAAFFFAVLAGFCQ